MNRQAHWLSLFAAIGHLTIGLSDLFRIGPRFLPPSWQVIYMVLPDSLEWLYPALWVVAGVTFLFGLRWPAALRIGFRVSAVLFLAWAIAGVPALTLGMGGNIQGAAANLFTAGCTLVLAHYVGIGVRGNATNVQIARLAELVMPDQVEDQVDEPGVVDG